MAKLDNKVAIVTGGGIGIGKAIACKFAKNGADVVVCGRNLTNLEKVAAEIAAIGHRSLALAADVTIADDVYSMVKRTIYDFHKIDILVNNAGITCRKLLVNVSEEEWDKVIATNLKGTFLCTKACANYMVQQRYGKIINIGSTSGLHAHMPNLAAYSASKAGVIQLTKNAALELAPYGINVNCISPGPTDTDFLRKGRTPEQFRQLEETEKKHRWLGRLGTTQEIANLALFLASDDSSYIVGTNIVIDGGN
jgi:NAD(P)-dependent dehydrogenase (short-subunit alcohol dehydrogenase family)